MTETLANGYSYKSIQSYLMNTNMAGFRCFSKLFGIGRVNLRFVRTALSQVSALVENLRYDNIS